MSDVSTPVSLKLAWNADDPLLLAQDLLPGRVLLIQLTPKGIHMEKSLIKTIIMYMAIFSLAGCGETYDADNPTESVNVLKTELENQAAVAEFDELWDIYQRGYVNDQAEATGPDYSRFDGMNAEEMHKELREYVDWIDVSGMFIAPPGYIDGLAGNSNKNTSQQQQQTTAPLSIEKQGSLYFTAREDEVIIEDIIVDRGNCVVYHPRAWRSKPVSLGEKLALKKKGEITQTIPHGNVPGAYLYYWYRKPFPVAVKFGKRIHRTVSSNCGAIEVTAVTDKGEWTWKTQ